MTILHRPTHSGAQAVLPAPPVGRSLLGPALMIATVLGALEAAKGFWLGRGIDPGFGITRALATNMPWWYLWAALVPLIAWISRRAPLERGRLAGSIPVHLAASLVLSFAHLTLSAVLVWAASSYRFQGLDAQLRSFLAGYFFTNLVTYWAVAATLAALSGQRRLQSATDERNRLALEASRLQADAARLREQMTEARLSALRSELNPHFLYNALNGVSALARKGDTDGAVAMVSRLGRLLRRTLDPRLEREVTLSQELELLELYLSIERIRYGERMSVAVVCGRGAGDVLVPSLLLQPLVENAVRHGVAAVRGHVQIEVSTRLEEGRLRIEVADTGAGVAREGFVEGVGLGNTRRRLATAYGEAASLSVGRRAEGGTRVTLELPAHLEASAVVSEPSPTGCPCKSG